MGCSVYAHAVIGLRVPWNKVCTGKKKIKAFEHNHPKDWDVDPKSGKKLWREVPTFIDAYDSNIDGLGGYSVLKEPMYDSRPPDNIIVCLLHAGTDDAMEGCEPVKTDIRKLNENLAKFRQVMEKLGVWDNDEFGLWAVAISYP